MRISQQYLSAQILSAVRKAAGFFGDGDMMSVLSAVEGAMTEPEEIPALYQRFRKIAPASLVRIGATVKANSGSG